MASFERPRQLSPQRTALILLAFCAVLGGFAYLCYLPLMQVYWGVYGRIKPMLSEEDLVAAGKPLPPGTAHVSSPAPCPPPSWVLACPSGPLIT